MAGRRPLAQMAFTDSYETHWWVLETVVILSSGTRNDSQQPSFEAGGGISRQRRAA